MDGKSQAWRDAADRLLEALARENKYIVGDMLVIFLESAGYGLESYEPLGGVFKRAANKGIIYKIDRPTKQALWLSHLYVGTGLGKDYKGNTGTAYISQCKNCDCMTKNICGKCKAEKGVL